MCWSSCTQPSHIPPQGNGQGEGQENGWHQLQVKCWDSGQILQILEGWVQWWQLRENPSSHFSSPVPYFQSWRGMKWLLRTSLSPVVQCSTKPAVHMADQPQTSSHLPRLCTTLTQTICSITCAKTGGVSSPSPCSPLTEPRQSPWICWLKRCEVKHRSCQSSQIPSPITCSLEKAPSSNASSFEFAGDLISVSRRNYSCFVSSLQLNTAALCSADVQEGRQFSMTARPEELQKLSPPKQQLTINTEQSPEEGSQHGG